jgi:hypothetical protein
MEVKNFIGREKPVNHTRLSMTAPTAADVADLTVGEIIEIKYRVPLPKANARDSAPLVERWIMAEIIYQETDTPPMARLFDGQLTDIRAYMTWRHVSRRNRQSRAS